MESWLGRFCCALQLGGGLDSTQSEFNLKMMFFPRDNVMDDPFVMDNPFLGLFLCLPAWLSAGRWWWGRGGYKARRRPRAPAGSRPTGGSVSLRRLYSLPEPAPSSGSVLFRPKIQILEMVPPPTRAPRKAPKNPQKLPRGGCQKSFYIPVKW